MNMKTTKMKSKLMRMMYVHSNGIPFQTYMFLIVFMSLTVELYEQRVSS